MPVIRIIAIQFHRARRENTVLTVIVHAMEKKDLLTCVSESPGGIFAVTAHLGPHFSCFLPILFTSRTWQSSHVEAHCSWKNQKRKRVLGKKRKKKKKIGSKKKKGEPFCQEKKKIPCESDWYWRNSTLACRFRTEKSPSSRNLSYIKLKTRFAFIYPKSTSHDTKSLKIALSRNFET